MTTSKVNQGLIERLANAPPRIRWIVSALALVLYFPLFLSLLSVIGNVALAVVFVPALVWSMLQTPRFAFFGSLALAIPNYFILHGLQAMSTPQEDVELIASHLVIGLLSYALGYGFALRRDLSNELTARKKSDALFRGLFDRSNDAVFILSTDLRILDVNDQGARILGYTTAEMIGMDYHKLVAAGEGSDLDDRLGQVLTGAMVPLYERSLRKKDGSTVLVEVNAALIRDPQGDPLHIQSLCRDITERKAAGR